MFPSEDTNLAWGWKEDEAKLHRHRHEPAASLGTLASYRMALCVARCPEWQTSPLAYLDGSPGDLFRQDYTKLAWVSYCSTYTVVFGDAHSRTKCPGGQVCKKIHKHLLWPSWNHLTRCSLMLLGLLGVFF